MTTKKKKLRKKQQSPAERNQRTEELLREQAMTPITESAPRTNFTPLELVHWELYDRVPLVIPPPSFREGYPDTCAYLSPPKKAHFFLEALGHRGKGLVQTNQMMPGQLDPPKKFTLRVLAAEIFEDGQPVEKSARIWHSSCVQLEVGGKVMFVAPAAVLSREYPLSLPVLIGQQQHFACTFESDWACRPDRKFEVGIRLIGEMYRAIL